MSLQKVDIESTGSVYAFLSYLLDKKIIKECDNIYMEHFPVGYYEPHCHIDFCERVDFDNVAPQMIGYNKMLVYRWPKCPKNCPHFIKSGNFAKSALEDKQEKINKNRPPKKPNETNTTASSLAPPAKVTLKWLWDHVPLKIWIVGGAILLSTLSIGFTLGKSDFFVKAYSHLKSVLTATHSTTN